MMNSAVIILLLVTSVMGTSMRLLKLETCNNHPEAKSHFTEIQVYDKNGTQYMKYVLNVSQETSSWNKMILQTVKCPNKNTLENCQHYRNFTLPHIGNLAGLETTSVGKKVIYKPPLRFPLKRGLYVTDDTKLETIWSILVPKGYWKGYASILTDKGELALCVCAECEAL